MRYTGDIELQRLCNDAMTDNNHKDHTMTKTAPPTKIISQLQDILDINGIVSLTGDHEDAIREAIGTLENQHTALDAEIAHADRATEALRLSQTEVARLNAEIKRLRAQVNRVITEKREMSDLRAELEHMTDIAADARMEVREHCDEADGLRRDLRERDLTIVNQAMEIQRLRAAQADLLRSQGLSRA